MARSSYIYVVKYAGDIAATFTVKHEMLTWLRRHADGGASYQVWRYPDGLYRDGRPAIEITHEFFPKVT